MFKFDKVIPEKTEQCESGRIIIGKRKSEEKEIAVVDFSIDGVGEVEISDATYGQILDLLKPEIEKIAILSNVAKVELKTVDEKIEPVQK